MALRWRQPQQPTMPRDWRGLVASRRHLYRFLLLLMLPSLLQSFHTAPAATTRAPRLRPLVHMAARDGSTGRLSRFYRIYPVSLGEVDGEACVVLSSAKSVAQLQSEPSRHSVLCLPTVEPRGAAAMLENAVQGVPMSKSAFLRLAPALVNRDGGLYDELPWREWTVGDPFFAKRDCFERFLGRDYPGQSLKAQNLAGALRDRLDQQKSESGDGGGSFLDELLADMNSGERAAPYRGAYGFAPIAETTDDRNFAGYASPYALMAEVIGDQMRATVEAVFLEDAWLADDTIRIGGAIELKRRDRDASEDDVGGGGGGGNDGGGGTTTTEMVNIGGFMVPNPVTNAALRAERGLDATDAPVGGDRVVVDCLPDEAIGVALSCQQAKPCPIYVEKEVWAAAAVAGSSLKSLRAKMEGSTRAWAARGQPKVVLEVVTAPARRGEDDEVDEERERGKAARRVGGNAKTTAGLGGMGGEEGSSGGGGGGVASRYEEERRRREAAAARTKYGGAAAWEIPSASSFESMSARDKARSLLSTEAFKGKVPRPRKVLSERGGDEAAIDELVLPLMDEAVRREVLLQRAARDGDWRLVEELRAKQSLRGRAREALERAEREGADDGTIAALRQEVALQTSLRADYSQDEGEYSRFLDKDDWYERDRRRAMGLDRPD